MNKSKLIDAKQANHKPPYTCPLFENIDLSLETYVKANKIRDKDKVAKQIISNSLH
jgi:hypothetical protein